MVDVVANHLVSLGQGHIIKQGVPNGQNQGYAGAGNTVDYSVFNPFNANDYFHSYCEVTDYSNQTNVEDCWLGDTTVSLPDLNTESETVQNIWYSWVGSLVSNYSSKLSTSDSGMTFWLT